MQLCDFREEKFKTYLNYFCHYNTFYNESALKLVRIHFLLYIYLPIKKSNLHIYRNNNFSKRSL